MKQIILLGLTAIAIGIFSSCSNILEDSGVNFPAKGQTGELSLSINTDPTVFITTKVAQSTATDVDLTAFEDRLKIEGTTASKPSVDLGTSAEYKNGASKVVAADTYTKISASYDGMNGKALAFDAPIIYGEYSGNVVVKPNSVVDVPVSIKAGLRNSIITIDEVAFTKLCSMANISKLCVYEGVQGSLPSELFSLLAVGGPNTLESANRLFVKDNANNIYIHIEGNLKADPSKSFKVTQQIKEQTGSTTAAAKNYCVKYALLTTQGSLNLTITVDGAVIVVPIDVLVDPYQPAA